VEQNHGFTLTSGNVVEPHPVCFNEVMIPHRAGSTENAKD
jgi:hypothetical protein